MNTRFSNYIDKLKNKRIAVIGIGVSNTPLIKTLLAYGCDVTACDKNEKESFGTLADELVQAGAKLKLGPDYLDALDYDLIFRTPGIRPDTPQIAVAVANGAELTSEMEAFFEVCVCPIVAVTGSDGKTTTTTIISELLKEAGKTVYIGGNIGKPLFTEAANMNENDVAVLELSSFQLMTMKRSPHIAVITNIAPNHLDYHRDMDEYVEAKKSVFKYQTSKDILVLNGDNALAAALKKEANSEVRMFSHENVPQRGCFSDGETIWWCDAGGREKIISVKDIVIPGLHNVENYMAAFSAVYDIVGAEVCHKVASEFKGVEHRIELVRKWNGISFYNDSIASSPTRTMAGLKSFSQKVILIAGGYDKHIPYDVLGPVICEHVKTLVLTGATAEKIKNAVLDCDEYRAGFPEIVERDDFTEAVLEASGKAEAGDIVILSPASAAFDKFKNFAVRGRFFKEIVNGLK